MELCNLAKAENMVLSPVKMFVQSAACFMSGKVPEEGVEAQNYEVKRINRVIFGRDW